MSKINAFKREKQFKTILKKFSEPTERERAVFLSPGEIIRLLICDCCYLDGREVLLENPKKTQIESLNIGARFEDRKAPVWKAMKNRK